MTAIATPKQQVEKLERSAARLAYRAMNITGNEDADATARHLEAEADRLYAEAGEIRDAHRIPNSWHW